MTRNEIIKLIGIENVELLENKYLKGIKSEETNKAWGEFVHATADLSNDEFDKTIFNLNVDDSDGYISMMLDDCHN